MLSHWFPQGRDATQLFEAYHPIKIYPGKFHSKSNILIVLQKYYIGEVKPDEDHPMFPPMSEFYITLKGKIENYFESNEPNFSCSHLFSKKNQSKICTWDACSKFSAHICSIHGSLLLSYCTFIASFHSMCRFTRWKFVLIHCPRWCPQCVHSFLLCQYMKEVMPVPQNLL